MTTEYRCHGDGKMDMDSVAPKQLNYGNFCMEKKRKMKQCTYKECS
jgi:hypothetical protein